MGELAFGRAFDLTVDFRDQKGQTDGGVDFTLPSGVTVDVKVDTVVEGREPAILLHAGKTRVAEVLVLVTLMADATKPTIKGWAWTSDVQAQPEVKTKRDTTVHLLRANAPRFHADIETLRVVAKPAALVDHIEPGVTWTDLEDVGRLAFGIVYQHGMAVG